MKTSSFNIRGDSTPQIYSWHIEMKKRIYTESKVTRSRLVIAGLTGLQRPAKADILLFAGIQMLKENNVSRTSDRVEI